jgi:hypothetical protein
VAQKYGGSFSNEVGADYNRLDKQVHNDLHKNMSNHYAEGKQNLSFSYNNTANEMDGKTQKVQSDVDKQISENAQVIETARPDVAQIKSDEVAVQESLQKQKTQFDHVSDSTLQRSGAKSIENSANLTKKGYQKIGLDTGAKVWEDVETIAKKLQKK